MRQSAYPCVVRQWLSGGVYDAVVAQQASAAHNDIVRRPQPVDNAGATKLHKRCNYAIVSDVQLLQRSLKLHSVIVIEHHSSVAIPRIASAQDGGGDEAAMQRV